MKMNLKLKESHRHKSATGIGELDLDGLTVISGVNGAGKTHFLQAIQSGAIRAYIDDQLVETSDIALYDWTDFEVSRASEASASLIRQQAEQSWNQLAAAKRHSLALELVKAHRSQIGIVATDRQLLSDPIESVTVDQTAQGQIETLRREYRQTLLELLAEDPKAKVLRAEATVGKLITEMSSLEFQEAVRLDSQSIGLLQQQVSNLFVAYNSLLYDNDSRRALTETTENDFPHRTPDQFLETFGPRPWVVLNDLLADQGLDFKVDAPSLTDTTHIVRLVQQTSGAEVPFEDLSSGEKVLMALAVSLYGVVEERHKVVLPKLMLLDEIDAPLHPAMVRTYLRTVENVLVRNGIPTILTTHSPITVALCLEGSVWRMTKAAPRLERVSNEKALVDLTTGVPALTVRFQERRQVFVESRYDANIYAELLDYLRPRLDSDIGLQFLPASQSKNEGGSSLVVKVVEGIRDAGVDTVSGVVDWDLTNEPSADGSIFVLGSQRRYTIENYILDPLLIGALLIREKRTDLVPGLDAILSSAGTWRGLDRADPVLLQQVIDLTLALLSPPVESDPVACPLVSGEVVHLPIWFCQAKGHDLYGEWTSAVPFLQSFRSESGLKRAIVERVVADVPELLSIDLLELLVKLTAPMPDPMTALPMAD